MAKSNGSTRSSTPRSMYGGQVAEESGLTMAQYQQIVNTLAGGDYPAGWTDLDQAHRELALMEAGFTGYANEDASDILFPADSRDAILSDVIAAVINDNDYGSGVNDNISITVAYKDGTTRSVGALGNEIELSTPLTRNQRYSTQESIVKSALRVRDIAYITHNDSYREVYWIAKGSEAQFRRYSGYEKWTGGRGEKRRDYIQDDWI